MLAPSRNHRAEVKYNVTTEFPHLGLHSAAASGDIGLVKYALTHGQPVNSVLDGVLPLHAACTGGRDLVVRLLIEHGADVNAPRLPSKYSDRNRDATAPIVGTSGSTPLHFAAANGHSSVVHILLHHGARADKPDKHGVTPELVARQNGWIECADVLRDWQANVERELRARGQSTPDSAGHSSRERSGSHCPIESVETSLRKRLHLKRSVDHALNSFRSTASSDPEVRPAVFRPSLSDQDVMPQARSPADTPPDASGRRPSLPSIYAERPQRLTAPSKSRRPRSAGTGAESTPPRKLNSKLSLLSLFKRSGADGSSSSVASGSEPAVNSPPSPIPIPGAASPASRPSLLPASPRNITLPLSSSPREGSFVRRGMEGSPGVRGHLPPASESSSRNRSASGASATSSMVPDEPSPEPAAAPVRPGILRMHNRSSSSGQGSSGYASSRIIRFESSSSTASLGGRHAQQQPQPESRLRTVSGGSAGPGGAADTIEEAPPAGLPMPPIVVDPADEDIEEEEEYGVPIDRADDGAPMQLRDPSVSSFALSISPSSPISPDEHEHGAAAAHFPFSIHLPPPVDDASLAEAQESPRRRESRLRGESVSSTSTDSNHPPSSASDATRTSNGSDATWMSNGSDATWTSSGSITTPTTPHSTLPLIAPSSPSPAPDSPHRNGGDPGPAPRRARVPSDIDIHAISSHAQAEALVARTEQSILNLEQYLEEHTRRDAGTGRTPLSAKLAAYGESLAIERRLKEEARRARAGGRVRASGSPDLDGRGGIGGRVRRGGLRNGARGGGDSGSSSEDTSLEDRGVRVLRTARSVSDDIPRAPRDTRREALRDTRREALWAPDVYVPVPAPRSLTPEPELPQGMPLSRVSTAPDTRRGRDQARHVGSANKLTQMGFATVDGWQPSSLAHSHGHGHGHKSRSPSGKSRFGGIRTIMQSFQGKG